LVRIISQSTREVWKRRLKGFWLDYSHNRIGLLGMVMLIFFLTISIFADAIAPFGMDVVSSEKIWQADRYALPDWITFFPGSKDLPPQQVHVLNWTLEQQPPASVAAMRTTDQLMLRYNASMTNSYDPVTVYCNVSFDYQYKPMNIFTLDFMWEAGADTSVPVYEQAPWGPMLVGTVGSMDYMLKIDLITPNSTGYPVWDQNWWEEKNPVTSTPPAFWNSNASQPVSMYSSLGVLAQKLGLSFTDVYKIPTAIFSEKGVYTLRLGVTMRPGTLQGKTVPLENSTGHVTVSVGDFIVWGRRFGLLGTDNYGHDVFSQVILGSRISIIIGLSSAIIATLIGTVVGLTAGYVGGWTDEMLMRGCDILICLPLLPILLVFIALFGYSVYYLILLLAIFGWQGLARLIRSQTLSLREMAFVESAVASGGKRGYVIWKHLLPNVLPAALTSLVLRVPGAVILEAALSFIGMGDPYAPTWGKILYNAQQTGAFTPQILAWWTVIPPGLAITFLCLTFVFIEHAVDEIVNPKLRRRR
jgi:peptide/nickel transport system permease protein